MVYKELPNKNFKNDNVPSVIKPYLVSRKFTLEKDSRGPYLQFGSGKAGESKNENLGIVPSNTTLTVAFRGSNPANSNIGVGVLNQINVTKFEFNDIQSLNNVVVGEVKRSLEVNNEEPIVGSVAYPNSTEVKRRIPLKEI